jgi:hypothetical protein
MRWRIHLHHEHGTHDIPNVIEGDTVNVPAGLAIQSVGLEPEPDTTVIPPTSVPGGPAEPVFAEPGSTAEPAPILAQKEEAASGEAAGLTP